MPKPPTPARCLRRLRRLSLRFCDALDNTYLLKQILEYRQKPFPPPGVPCLEDGPGWSEYLDRKTPAQKKKKTKKPGPDSVQGVVHGHFEFSVAAATHLLDPDSEKGRLFVRNPDRPSLLHDDLERSAAASGDDTHDLLAVCGPDLGEALSEEQLVISGTLLPLQEPASPTSPTSPLC